MSPETVSLLFASSITDPTCASFPSSFSHLVISFNDTAENGGNMANLLFSLCLIFCGVLATPSVFPRFWIFMCVTDDQALSRRQPALTLNLSSSRYRVGPFTYLAEGMLTTAIGATSVVCAADEFLQFQPTNDQTCQQYLEPYMALAGGYLKDPTATDVCDFCSISSTNVFLSGVSYSYDNRWVRSSLPRMILRA